MKKLFFTVALCGLLCAAGVKAENEWLHIRLADGRINTGEIASLDSLKVIVSEECDTLFDRVAVTRGGVTEVLAMADILSIETGTNVPTVNIYIADGAEVTSKEEYLSARIYIKGYGTFEDMEKTEVQIKGRGNSTWGYPKKPYRLKFPKKTSLCGLKKAKSYVLLANQLDCSLMRNAVCFELARMLGMPYTNHSIPVNLIVNGTYRGAYQLTEKAGINSGSVDIDDTEGVLFELDTNYDENWRYRSRHFKLPMMIKDPDFAEISEDNPQLGIPAELFAKWVLDFEQMEAQLASGSEGLSDLLDIESVAKYLLVNNIAKNWEVCHPKSVYMYKENEEDKYHMGPVWDFDWAFTFLGDEGAGSPTGYLLGSTSPGCKFLTKIAETPEFKTVYSTLWEEFITNVQPALLEYIDNYAETIRISALQNGELWPESIINDMKVGSSADFDTNVATLKDFIIKRTEYCKNARNFGLMW